MPTFKDPTYELVVNAWRAQAPASPALVDAFVDKHWLTMLDKLDERIGARGERQGDRRRTLLSMFDFTGNWARPFELFGWNVVQVDLKHGQDIGKWSARSMLKDLLQQYDRIDGIIAAPPCTEFANCGAQYWPEKDADGRTAAAKHLVYQVLRVVDYLEPEFHAIENPVGRIAKVVPELGAPALTFDPCDYAGWTTTSEDHALLDEIRNRNPPRCSREETGFVQTRGAYTKRTQLWGRFRKPLRSRVEPVKCTVQGSWLQALGGTSEKTKEERSITPEGFALAFAAAQVGASADQLKAVAARLLQERNDHEKSEALQMDLFTQRRPVAVQG